MPRLRPLLAGAVGGGLVFAVLAFWLRWPMFLSVAVAAVLGVLFLTMAAALSEEAQAADAAWRSAAADLFETAPPPGGEADAAGTDGAATLDSEPGPGQAAIPDLAPASTGDGPSEP